MKIKLPVSNFLKFTDVEDEDILEISGDVEYRSAEETKFGKEQYIIPVTLPNGEVKSYVPNKSSLKELVKAFGDETNNWKGKKFKVHIIEQNVSGKWRPVIYASPIEQ